MRERNKQYEPPLTRREKNMICLYDCGNRTGLLSILTDTPRLLTLEETALRSLAASVIRKLECMMDAEYRQLLRHIELELGDDEDDQ